MLTPRSPDSRRNLDTAIVVGDERDRRDVFQIFKAWSERGLQSNAVLLSRQTL